MKTAHTFISQIRWDIRDIWQGYMMLSVRENKETGLKNWGLKADHDINTILLTLVCTQMLISKLLYTFLMALSRSPLIFVFLYTCLKNSCIMPWQCPSVSPLVKGLKRLLQMVDFFHLVIQSHYCRSGRAWSLIVDQLTAGAPKQTVGTMFKAPKLMCWHMADDCSLQISQVPVFVGDICLSAWVSRTFFNMLWYINLKLGM